MKAGRVTFEVAPEARFPVQEKFTGTPLSIL